MSAMPERIRPYEGKEDYIFISYSHRDSERVFPLLRTLSAQGFRLWYDEGIDPGTEWPESIANHLAGCKVCLAFISPSSVKSTNCRREINFALSRNKDFLSVVLEPVEMSPGMEMQISTYQSLLSYKYPRWEDFEEKLLSVEILQPCRARLQNPVRESSEAQVFVQPKAETPTSQPPRASVPAVVHPAAMPADSPAPQAEPYVQSASPERYEAPERRDQISAAPQPAAPIPRPAAKKNAGKKKRNVLLIVLPAAAVLLALLIVLIVNPFRKAVAIGGKEYANQNSILIRDAAITAEQMRKLSEFDECKYLTFSGCSFEDGALGSLSAMTQMSSVVLENCTGAGDLSWLSAMDSLTSLTLNGCGLTDQSVSDLKLSSKIRTLDLSNNGLTRIPELHSLADLSDLKMENNGVSDLSPLAGLKKITKLNFNGNKIGSLHGIEEIEKLKELYLSGNQVQDVSLLDTFVYLEKVNLSGNDVRSAQFLPNCTTLSYVNLRGCSAVKDVAFLQKNAEKLTFLDLSGITGVDFSALSFCRNLKTLNVVSCGLDQLSFVSGMTELQTLNAAHNSIADLTPLENCVSLTVVNLADNRIRSLNGLPQARVEEGKSNPMFSLLLHNNQLTDLNGIDPDYQYKILTVFGNPLSDGNALKGVRGYRLLTEMGGAYDPANLTGFTKVYVPEKITEYQLAWEKALNTRLSYTETAEALEESLKYADVLKSVVFKAE